MTVAVSLTTNCAGNASTNANRASGRLWLTARSIFPSVQRERQSGKRIDFYRESPETGRFFVGVAQEAKNPLGTKGALLYRSFRPVSCVLRSCFPDCQFLQSEEVCVRFAPTRWLHPLAPLKRLSLCTRRKEKSALRLSLFIGFYRSTDTLTVCGWSFFI